MATIRKASGSLTVTATLDGGRTFNSAGGGYAVILKSDDENAINLLSRARKHASAEVHFEFFEIEEVIDPEDPDQLKLDGLQEGEPE